MMGLVTGLLMNRVETDADGNVVNMFSNQYVGIAVTAILWSLPLVLASR